MPRFATGYGTRSLHQKLVSLVGDYCFKGFQQRMNYLKEVAWITHFSHVHFVALQMNQLTICLSHVRSPRPSGKGASTGGISQQLYPTQFQSSQTISCLALRRSFMMIFGSSFFWSSLGRYGMRETPSVSTEHLGI